MTEIGGLVKHRLTILDAISQTKSESVLGAWHWWSPGEMRAGFSGFSALFEMLENLFDDRRILDTGNNLDGAATIATKTI